MFAPPQVQVPVSAASAALPVGHDRAAALFRAYDVLGRGVLDRPSMVAALAELGVAAGLGEDALNQVRNLVFCLCFVFVRNLVFVLCLWSNQGCLPIECSIPYI